MASFRLVSFLRGVGILVVGSLVLFNIFFLQAVFHLHHVYNFLDAAENFHIIPFLLNHIKNILNRTQKSPPPKLQLSNSLQLLQLTTKIIT